MKRIQRLLIVAFLATLGYQAEAAVYYRLSYDVGTQTYTVSFRSTIAYNGAMARVTNSTQIAIVAPDPDGAGPMSFMVTNLNNLTDLQWGLSQVNSPAENSGKDYLFFAPANAGSYTPFDIPVNTWIDLFSFQTSTACIGPLYLFNNESDPLNTNVLINSKNNFKVLGNGNVNLYVGNESNNVGCTCVTYKMTLDPDGQTYRVSFRSAKGFSGPLARIAGSTQFTIVLPDPDGVGPGAVQITNLTALTSLQITSAQLNSPAENPLKDYVFFTPDNSGAYTLFDIPANTDVELFTFRINGGCTGEVYLYDNHTDPLNANILVNADNNFRTLGGGNVNLYCDNEGGPLACPDCLLTNITMLLEDVSCAGSADGEATAVVADGTGIYSYQWSANANSQTTQTAVNLQAGVYTVTVTDGLSCSGTAEATINQPESLSASVSSHTDILCFGGADGTATVSAQGGVGPYVYLWSSGSADQTATGLSAGTHTVTVTDANNCTTTAEITLTEPASALSVAFELDDASCLSGDDGSATATPSGGTGLYDFSWSIGLDEYDLPASTAHGLAAGGYTLLVTDANGCTVVGAFEIGDPTGVSLVVTEVNSLSCYAAADGAATVVANGGTSPYDFLWSNNQSELDLPGPDATASLTGLAAGMYFVTVVDAGGCSAVQTIILEQPTLLLAEIVNQTDESCPGSFDASATVNATGGTTPYTYDWSNDGDDEPDDDTNTAGFLTAGVYTVTVTDANGCSATTTVTIGANLAVPNLALIAEGPAGAVCGDEISVHIQVEQFENIGSFQFSIAWDETELQLTGNAALPVDGDAPVIGTPVPGQLTYSWADGDLVPYGAGLADGTTILTLNFNVLTNMATGVSVSITGVPTPVEATTGDFCPVVVTAFNEVNFDVNKIDVVCPAAISTCLESVPFTLPDGTPEGGTFSGDGVTNGEFDPATAGAGVHIISYTGTDANGCSNTCTFNITVISLSANPVGDIGPVCPGGTVPAILLSAMPNDPAIVYSWSGGDGAGLADGNSSGLNPAIPSFTAGNTEDTYTVTVTAALGACTATTTFTIEIEDVNGLTWVNCPADIAVNNDVDKCCANVNWIPPTALDDCAQPNNVMVSGPTGGTPGTCFAVGSAHVISYTATDGNGNTITCSFTITVSDMQLPSAVCKNIAITLDEEGVATIDVSEVNNNSSDNCSGVTVDIDIDAFDCDDLGQNIVILTATDAADNTASCMAVVTVVDEFAPVLSCPDDLTAVCFAAEQPVYETWNDFLAEGGNGSDNCLINEASFILESETDNGLVCPRTITRTYRIADQSGNTATCSQQVVVDDNEAPVLVGLPAESEVTGDCTDDLPAIPAVTATDNCTSPIDADFTETIEPGDCANSYVITRTWSAVDACGNATSFTQTIEINDNEAPVLVGLPAESEVTGDCTDDLPAIPAVTATDNCTSPIDADFTETIEPGDCANSYVITRTWSAVDACGNATSFTQTIEINDNEAPVLVGLPAESEVTGDCTDDLPAIPAVTATDNCTSPIDADFTETIEPGDCANSYVITRTWSAVDACGNATSFTQVITIDDNEVPVLVGLPAESEVTGDCTDDLPAIPAVTATDNCTSPIDADFTETIEPGDCANSYVIMRTWSAVDACGNATSFTQVITIDDNEAPVLVGLPAESEVTGDCTDDLPAIPAVTATDNCTSPIDADFTETIEPGDCANSYVITRTWSAVDACGNATSFTQTIEINDNEAPVLVGLPAEAEVTGDCTDDLPAIPAVTATDNCTSPIDADFTETIEPGDCANSYVITRTWSAVDACGNATSFTQTIEINDNEAPVLVGLPAESEVTGDCTDDLPAIPAVTATDNCTSPIDADFTETIEPGDCANSYVITRTWSAVDACGNATSFTQTIEINDNEAPVLVGLPAESEVTGDCTDDLPAIPAVTATDNCTSPIDADFTETIEPGDCANSYVITRTWSAVDACGNATSFTQTIEINDNEAPVLVGLPAESEVTGDCTDDLPAIPAVTATDNCTSPIDADFTETIEPGDCANSYVITRTWSAVDACGNATSFTQTIEINDNEAPVLVGLPAESEVTGDCTDDLPAIPAVTATDNCTSPIDADFTETIEPGDCANSYVITRTWSAVDACGNATSFTQTIEINDNEAPVLVGLPAESEVTGDCTDDLPAIPAVTATDNCTSPIDADFTETIEPGDCANSYVITRTWSAVDACGNATSFTQTIEINDNEAPVLVGLPAESEVTGDCTDDLPAIPAVTATDNCTSPIDADFTETIEPGDCANSYVITRTWSAVDACGNATSFTQTIEINDNEVPVLVGLPAESEVTGDCTDDLPAIPAVTATDNCTSPIDADFTETIEPGDCANSYVITRTWSAVDACGNATSFTQTIEINDNEAPVLVGLPAESEVTGDCTDDLPAIPAVTATDNCTSPIDADFTETIEPGDCANSYVITRTWSAVDACGNATSFTQTIEINDNEAPVLVGLPAESEVTGDCTDDLPAIPAVTATDNCTSPIDADFTETIEPGDCANSYVITRTWSAVDACGNATSFTQTIEINDNEAPVLVGLPAESEVTGDCTDDLPAIPAVTATDNCTSPIDADFTETIEPGDCANSYVITRTWSAVDACGNATSFTQVITIDDNEAPVLVGLPAESEVTGDCTDDLPAIPAVTATDNCTSPIDADFTETIEPGDCANSYVITRTWSAVDACGNATSFTQTIEINDNEAPVLVGLPAESEVTGDCTDDLPAIPAVTATDNCTSPIDADFTETIEPGDCANSYVITRTWSAVDACGNATSFTQTIEINDNEAPVLVGLPAESEVTGDCTDDLPAIPAVTATDNCTSPIDADFTETIEPGDCANSYVITRTWSAVDACGNATSFTQTIEINDNEAPVLVGLPAESEVTGDCTDDLPAIPAVTATDNCTSPIDADFTETIEPGDCANSYVITRTWSAVDACGNATSFTQVITIDDNEAPVLEVLPVDRTYDCVEDVETAPIQRAEDNCGEVTIDFSEFVNPGACPNQLVINRRWVAYDLCGNSSEWWQEIVVYDDELPQFVVTPVDRTYECLDDVEGAPDQGTIATDNCDVVFVDFMETRDNDSCQNRVVITRRWEATDLCGNKNTHWQVITVQDDKAPVLLTTPSDRIVACAEDIPVAPVQVVEDNCDVAYIEFAETTEPGGCANQYSITRRWYAYDVCGNTAEHWQTITVNDSIAPVWTSGLPADVTVQCGEEVQGATLTAEDNCAEPVDIEINETLLPGAGPNDGGVLIRTWTATDACGNSIQHIQTVTIQDNIAPELHDTPSAEMNVVCSEDVPAVASVTATDNCQGTVDLDFNETILPGDCAHNFTLTRTWTAVDFAGNSTSFVQTVTVNDDVAPQWVSALPADVTVQCGEDVPTASLTAADNCSGDVLVEFSETSLPGSGPNDGGRLIRTWTAYDVCGNSIQHVQTITIQDGQAPQLQGTPAANVSVSCAGEVPAVAVVTATDNCQGTVDVDFNETILPGDCAHNFTLTRTWTAVDFAGNSTSFVQTVTVNDDVAPQWVSALPADVTVQCGEDVPTASLTAADNCSGDVLVEFSETSLPGSGPNDGGRLIRTWTAYDVCGNSIQYVQTITIQDGQAPQLQGTPAANVSVSCAGEVPAVAVVTATDNCQGTVDLDFNETIQLSDCAHNFTLTRTWTAVDFAGNSTSFVQTVTVNDDVAPQWVSALPADVTVQCGEDVPTASLTAADNCSGDVLVEFSETSLPGSGPNDGGRLIRTWTAYDVCGNSIQYVQTITIQDGQAPQLQGTPAANVSVSCAGEVPAVAVVTATDNCQGTVDVDFNETIQLSDCAHNFTLTRTWTAVDFAGNSTIFVQTVTVNDETAPLLACPLAQVAQCTVDEIPVYDNLAEFETAGGIASDNCGLNSSLFGLMSQTQAGNVYTRIYRITDQCGNSSTCTQTITVLDTESPVFVNCPDHITVGNDVDKCGANVVFSTPVAEDNCDVIASVTQTSGLASGSLFGVGTSMIVFTASDPTGNTSICSFTITVMDMQAPNAVCNDISVNLNASGVATIAPALIGSTSTDNCPAALTLTPDQTMFDCSDVGDNNVTLTVTDGAGNASTCVSTVTVRDVLQPVFTCPSPQTVNGCDGLVPDLVILVTDASDNCGIASITQNPVAGSDFGNANGQSIVVTITVTDVNGNVRTCQVPVTIDDDVPPVFVNCPTTMIMVANDVDQCSGKLNWSIPVATDNCALFSIVQIAGPAPGTVVPVGQPVTVTYRAFDTAGNSSTCSFQVQVVDTQIPELDDDIVMPANVTVECDAVAPAFVLTNDDVKDNCTASEDLVIEYTEVRTDGNCPNNYVLTRTWTITDEAGNKRVHTQRITVRDTTAPVSVCQNVTITLDKFGNATVTAGQVNNGSTDNCSAPDKLTLTVTPNTFTCANLGANVVTLTVTDECGNSSTCTAIVTVEEGIGPCEPSYSAETSCLNNATTLIDGQFLELITVKSLSGQTWTLSANTGLFAPTSAAPPAAPTALAVGTALTMGTADGIDNDGDGQTDEADEMVYYTLRGIHVEAVGYGITLTNNLGETATISNKGYYPTPYFKNLYDPFCIETPPFTIEVGEYNNAVGVVTQITVNGVITNIFNAQALGLGFHTVTATFDAGVATTNLVINGELVGGTDAEALADPGCQQTITQVIQIVGTPTVVVCNDLVHISLGADCVADISPDDVLEGTYACFDDYSVVLTYPAGTNTYNPPNRVDATHIGKTLDYTLVHALSGNMCWGKIKVEDKLAPTLSCPDNITIACSESTAVANTGNVGIDDCSSTTTQVDDEVEDNGECGNPRQVITRTFFVTDQWGNQAACTQNITIIPFDLSDVVFPSDITVDCEDAYLNTAATQPSNTGRPSINGAPIGNGTLCSASIGYTDERLEICPGSYEIYRTWKIGNTCLPLSSGNPITHIQRIRVKDFGGPQFACPGDVTVSVDPFSCCATAALPDMIVSEGCSGIISLEAKVTGIDPATGNVITFTVAGHLADFAGNNYWEPDTLAVFPYTQCLPMGTYTVRYTAEDGCGNTSSCEFAMTVSDLIPPVAACDEFTQVALGSNGEALVNASTFDDGSYDQCGDIVMKARRMDANDCQDHEYFLDQVKFCCEDVNDTITVVFRVYDVAVQSGAVGEDEYEGHYNDCMVQVFVEDKLKPICEAPANVTVSCENFDPSLWAYGFATATDNCCVDTITVATNYGLFDTVCNKGTITRTFRAIDCGGQSNQCTQRVFVSYEQDYWVKFPNDVIVSVCDGTGNYGEPEFYGEDCELLGVSFEDEVFTVVPDACFKIERTWSIINWCTYNANLPKVVVPNPNPNPATNHPSNLTGPIVSPAGTPQPWNPTVVAIAPGQTPTNYSVFWDANANGYTYKQIIKIIDTQEPVVENCPDSTVTVCDLTANDPLLWNQAYWWDNTTESHNLCEGPSDLTITATDLCSGANISFRYLLFLDLDGDGTMETVVNSVETGLGGLGWNQVFYGNASNPNYTGGASRTFDNRPVQPNQKYGFALQTTASGNNVTASVRWNTQASQNTYVVPELPYGTHKIKWFVEDGCGNETECEYTFVVKDCKAPTVVCINGLSVNIMPTQMITLWASDFLQYTEDNCTPSGKIVTAIRKSGTGTGFPLNPDGTPQKSVTFTCDELGTQLVELWSRDLAGNADYCETYVIVQDPNGFCGNDHGVVAGALKTETEKGLADADVQLNGSSPGLPPVNLFENTDHLGAYVFAGVPYLGDYTVTPLKDNDHLNGVSTFDLVLINKHILGLEPLNSPYKMIAADANNSRSITTFDIVELRKLILGIYTELPNNTSWRFIDEDYVFPNPINPFQEIFPETRQIADMQLSQLNQNFVAVKVGDVNLNAVTSSLVQVDDRTSGALLFDVQDRTVKAGETFTVSLRAAEKVKGYQFTLHFPNLEVLDVTPGADMTLGNFGIFNGEHSLTTSFDNEQVQGEFTLTFRAKAGGKLSEMLSVSGRITKAEAYGVDAGGNDRMAVALRFNGANGPVLAEQGFELYQNAPNPWISRTQIGFYLPEASEATLTVYDETGRLLYGTTGDFGKGYNAFTLDRAVMNTTGMLYYKVETPTDSAVKTMIQIR